MCVRPAATVLECCKSVVEVLFRTLRQARLRASWLPTFEFGRQELQVQTSQAAELLHRRQ